MRLFAYLIVGLFMAQLARVFLCRWKCRTWIEVPWSGKGIPRLSSFALASRTRDGSRLYCRDVRRCVLILWQRPESAGWGLALADYFTGGTHVSAVSIDCGFELKNRPWMITSGPFASRTGKESGPHYHLFGVGAGNVPGMAGIDLSGHIDAGKLRADLQKMVADRSVRHRSPWNATSYMTGFSPKNRVTCSGLIGAAILRQAESRLAAALRQALLERPTYGEITPADLARTAGILRLKVQGVGKPVQIAPIARPRFVSKTKPVHHPEVNA